MSGKIQKMFRCIFSGQVLVTIWIFKNCIFLFCEQGSQWLLVLPPRENFARKLITSDWMLRYLCELLLFSPLEFIMHNETPRRSFLLKLFNKLHVLELFFVRSVRLIQLKMDSTLSLITKKTPSKKEEEEEEALCIIAEKLNITREWGASKIKKNSAYKRTEYEAKEC